MNQETKQCEKCKNNFTVEPDDFAFYEKLDLPSPAMCQECRFKYLLAFWVNGRFRIAKSALSGKKIITVLPESVPFPIYERNEFISDNWDPLIYGRDYDSSQPFLEQLVELQSVVPHPHQVGIKNTNCDWADDIWESKDAYLTRSALHLDSVIYGYRLINCKNCVDTTFSFDLERCYDCLNCFKSYGLKYSFNCRQIFRGFQSKETIDTIGALKNEKCALGSNDQISYGNLCCFWTTSCRYSSYLDNCEECEYCFGCVGLRKKKYCILNKQYAESEYKELVGKIKSDMKNRGEWGKFWPLSAAYSGYNLSLAGMQFPMTKEDAIKFGAKWDEVSEPHYENTISGDDLPDSIDEVKDDIIKQRILCPETKLSYNITKDELQFYREYKIPLPRRHFDWRTQERYKPFSLMATKQQGVCTYCKKEIEHYYSPQLGFQKIACLECYQRQVA